MDFLTCVYIFLKLSIGVKSSYFGTTNFIASSKFPSLKIKIVRSKRLQLPLSSPKGSTKSIIHMCCSLHFTHMRDYLRAVEKASLKERREGEISHEK